MINVHSFRATRSRRFDGAHRAALALVAVAQDKYPSRPIEFIVPGDRAAAPTSLRARPAS
jgi:hypothetical protein